MRRTVISHRKRRRKRGSVWGWVLRRFGALTVTVAGRITTTWPAPALHPVNPHHPWRPKHEPTFQSCRRICPNWWTSMSPLI